MCIKRLAKPSVENDHGQNSSNSRGGQQCFGGYNANSLDIGSPITTKTLTAHSQICTKAISVVNKAAFSSRITPFLSLLYCVVISNKVLLCLFLS
jgi:hypothetical protein